MRGRIPESQSRGRHSFSISFFFFSYLSLSLRSHKEQFVVSSCVYARILAVTLQKKYFTCRWYTQMKTSGRYTYTSLYHCQYSLLKIYAFSYLIKPLMIKALCLCDNFQILNHPTSFIPNAAVHYGISDHLCIRENQSTLLHWKALFPFLDIYASSCRKAMLAQFQKIIEENVF